MSRDKIQKQEEYQKMAESQEPHTWSARMPAYCYTDICPEPRLREPLKIKKLLPNKIQSRGKGRNHGHMVQHH